MTVPFTLLMIKPMSVGRGDAPQILQDILEHCPVALRRFRAWSLCDTTLFALSRDKGPHASELDYDQESIHLPKHIPSWICLFTHLDRVTDPTDILKDYCGPLDPKACEERHLRFRYGGYAQYGNNAHVTDTVVHISSPERAAYESKFLFLEFKEDAI